MSCMMSYNSLLGCFLMLQALKPRQWASCSSLWLALFFYYGACKTETMNAIHCPNSFFVFQALKPCQRMHIHRHGFFFHCATYKTRTMSCTHHPAFVLALQALKPQQQASCSSSWFSILLRNLQDQNNEMCSMSWCFFLLCCKLQNDDNKLCSSSWFFYYVACKTKITSVVLVFLFYKL